MQTDLISHAPNVHERVYRFQAGEDKIVKTAMLSDLHWDNPKCDRELLKRHLNYCKENNIRIHINGDLFCLMQGKYDGRRAKGDIRPEHNKSNYLDALINDAVNWWKPYAYLIDVIGYGNHETSIIRHCETDPLERFITLLNYEAKTNVQKGGYGGWYIIKLHPNKSEKKQASFRIKYYHGSGGGGIVTRGEINFTRAIERYEGFDCFTMGHIHENKETWISREVCNNWNKIHLNDILLMNTGTYKEEYGDGSKGWHVERGAPPKVVGGRILELQAVQNDTGTVFIKPKSYRF